MLDRANFYGIFGIVMGANVLILTDQTVSTTLKRLMASKGFNAEVAHSVHEAQRKITLSPFDLVIDDYATHPEDEHPLVGFIRLSQFDVMTLALIKENCAQTRIKILQEGADDCLSQPFHPDELVLRAQALTRRKFQTKSDQIKTKHFCLDIPSSMLHCEWGSEQLRKKEFQILALLIQHRNRFVDKDRIIEKAWSVEETPVNSTVDVHIRRLRLKLRDYSKQIIRTSYGMGYMFCE
jgi:DNA-binding response OmpR family regulator